MVSVQRRANNGGSDGLRRRLEALNNRALYVGIPQEKSSRKGEEITNAELLYIHTHGIRKKSMRDEMDKMMNLGAPYSNAYAMYVMSHGSPLWQAPPRPVLEPAIEYYRREIGEEFSRVVQACLRGNRTEATRSLHRTGLLVQNYCRGWFVNPANHWPPNSPITIALKGSSRPLIDTGTLRKSIIYVIDEDQNRGQN